MKVICSGRKTSRTTQLIELAHEAEKRGEASYIICHSDIACMQVFQRAQEMGKPVAMPISFIEFRQGAYAMRSIKNFFFDNADVFLQQMTPVHIAAIVVEKEADEL